MVKGAQSFGVQGDFTKSVGKVVNFSNKGNIVLRCKTPPRLGAIIVDMRSNPIGKVIRITGPVASPYVILTPKVKDQSILRGLLGKDLYLSDRPTRSRDEGERRSDHRSRGPGKKWEDKKGSSPRYGSSNKRPYKDTKFRRANRSK